MKLTTKHYEALKSRCAVHWRHYSSLLTGYEANHKIKSPERAALMYIFRRAAMHNLYTPQEFNYTDAHILTSMRKLLAENERSAIKPEQA